MKVRYTIFGLIFVLSTLFFWSAIQNVLVPSRAQTAVNFRVFFLDKNIECNKNGLCLAYLYGSSDVGVKIAGVQGTIVYSANIQPLGFIQDDKCGGDSFGLTRQIGFGQTQLANGTPAAKFALGSLGADAQLKDGNHCIGALILQPTNITSVPQQGTISLTNSALWKAGGPAQVNVGTDTGAVNITINETAPIPSITPPGPGGPGGGTPPTMPPVGSCERRPEGDCSCDGKVDLVDWDMLRSSINLEGASCDVNGDAATNALDISIWLVKNDLLPGFAPNISPTITPTPGTSLTGTPVSSTPAPTGGSITTPGPLILTPTPTNSPVVSSPTPTPTPTATPTPAPHP